MGRSMYVALFAAASSYGWQTQAVTPTTVLYEYG